MTIFLRQKSFSPGGIIIAGIIFSDRLIVSRYRSTHIYSLYAQLSAQHEYGHLFMLQHFVLTFVSASGAYKRKSGMAHGNILIKYKGRFIYKEIQQNINYLLPLFSYGHSDPSSLRIV